MTIRRFRKQVRDRLGRWLIRNAHERAADYLALIVMGRQASPAEDYLPLWRERWTERGTCYCAETSTRNCPMHGNDDATGNGDGALKQWERLNLD